MSTEQTRYWCHVCNREVQIYMAPDPTCQNCNEQFIEELHSDDDPREFLAGSESQNEVHDNPDTSTDGPQRQSSDTAQFFSFGPRPRGQDAGELGDEVFHFFGPHPTNGNEENRTPGEGGPSPLANMLQNMLTNILGDNVEARGDSNQPMLFYGDYVNGNLRFRSANSQRTSQNTANTVETEEQDGHSAPADSTETNGNDGNTDDNDGPTGETPGGARINGINSILQYLATITGGTFDGGLVGNPNDYVFSQTALDNIITQLMEQTSGASAPAPAPDQIIDSLKKRSLSDKEKSQETDCAVCKDTFEAEEIVTELPCEHIFHDDCIKPWLKLNGTCPVCRHTVSPEKKEDETSDENRDTVHTSETNENSSSSNRNNPNHSNAATFTFINGQPVNGTNIMPASWPEHITSLFNSTGSAQSQHQPTTDNDQPEHEHQSPQTTRSTQQQSSSTQSNSNDSEHHSPNTSSQQKSSIDNNNDLDDDTLYMDLD